MEIGIGGLMHETHTFLPEKTGFEPFEQEVFRGDELLEARRNTNTALAGFINVCETEGVEIVPSITAHGGISGTVKEEVYNQYVSEMCNSFAEAANDLDGILLFLHGAMVTEERQDPETDIVESVREIVGDIPISIAMDLHGNIDPVLLDVATVVCGYQSSPHIDKAKTGQRAANLLLRTLNGEINPTMAIAKPGIVVPSPFSATTTSPAKDVILRALTWQHKPELHDITKWDRKSDILDITFFFGFAWSDVHQLGSSALVIVDGDQKLAQKIADDLSSFAWEHRIGLTNPEGLHSVKEGVTLAIDHAKEAKKPIVILDAADRLAETTYVLQELLEQDAKNAIFPLLCDPEAVEACLAAGEGDNVVIEVGSKTSPRGGGPVTLNGTVDWAGHITYTATGPITQGTDVDNGPTAFVQMDGILIQLTTTRDTMGLIDTDPIEQYGYDVSSFNIIVSKSKTHFRAVYEDLAEEIIIVDAPEYSPADLSHFDYNNLSKSIYPVTYTDR